MVQYIVANSLLCSLLTLGTVISKLTEDRAYVANQFYCNVLVTDAYLRFIDRHIYHIEILSSLECFNRRCRVMLVLLLFVR